MPPAARTNDLTSHGPPLNPGPGSPDVLIGFLPAWRAIPAGMGAGIESASDTMNNLMTSPSLDPATTPAKLSQVFAALSQDTGTAASKGAPGAPAATSSSQATLMTANVALTATYTAAAAVPGGEPAARTAYTLAVQAAAAAAMSAAMSAMAGMADMHICPIPVPIPPHGPGFVTKGSKSVFINKLPACREGDKVFEAAGGSDPIALGCQTVLIGDDGGGPATPDNAAAVAEAVAEAAQNTQAQSTAAALVAAAAAGTPLIEICPACAKMREAAQKPKHTLGIRVVIDGDDTPVCGITLRIALPDGTEETHTTDQDGVVLINDLDTPGACSVGCDIKGARLPRTYDFVAMGEAQVLPPESQQQPFSGCDKPPGGRIIAEIEEHKVKTGETLATLAQGNGMTWQQLAIFNWETCVLDQVDEHLRDDVGCKKRTRDSRSYVFDASDDPGIVYIPKPWARSGLPTDVVHTVRVRRIRSKTQSELHIRLHDCFSELMPGVAYEIDWGGGRVTNGHADQESFVKERLPPGAERCIVRWAPLTSEGTEAGSFEYELNMFVELLDLDYEETEGVRRRLHNLGHPVGRDLFSNLLSFQADHRLELTGVIDKPTKSKLRAIYDKVKDEH